MASIDFLNLPFDIRKLIYEQLFHNLTLRPLAIIAASSRRFPAILHSSRVLRHEALPIFYSLATFSLTKPDGHILRRPIDVFIPSTSPQRHVHRRIQRASVTHASSMYLDWWIEDLSRVCSILRSLRRFRFHYELGPPCGSGYRRRDVEMHYPGYVIDPAWDYRSGCTGRYVERARAVLRRRLLYMDMYLRRGSLERIASWPAQIGACDFAVVFRHVPSEFVVTDDEGELVRLPGLSCVAVLDRDGLRKVEEGKIVCSQVEVVDVDKDKSIEDEWLQKLREYLCPPVPAD